MKKNIVISAINLVEGGPLTILQECLRHLSITRAEQYSIIALVNNKALFSYSNITFLEFPKSKKNWINRLFYEYIYFNKLARQLKPFLWLSLHDITPRVAAGRRAVYCHNASPFYKLSLREALRDPRFALFHFFYRYLYSINIKRNNFVIVQQEWMREEFRKLYGINNVVVSYPLSKESSETKKCSEHSAADTIFFYPSFPRFFKNFEVVCNAAQLLNEKGIRNFKIYFTFNGSENSYAGWVTHKYGKIRQLNFLGIIPQHEVINYFQKTDCLIFSSKLESWGLPITEFKQWGKPMLLSDFAFAHEAAGEYNRAAFFNADDAQQLATLMGDFMHDKLVFAQLKPNSPRPPFAKHWGQLFDILLQ